MNAVLKDVADPTDPTLIAVHEWWPVGGDTIPKLSLHLHGDEAARSRAAELSAEIEDLRNPEDPLTLPELDARIRAVAARLGFEASATETRCASDPLETTVDVSVWRKKSG